MKVYDKEGLEKRERKIIMLGLRDKLKAVFLRGSVMLLWVLTSSFSRMSLLHEQTSGSHALNSDWLNELSKNAWVVHLATPPLRFVPRTRLMTEVVQLWSLANKRTLVSTGMVLEAKSKPVKLYRERPDLWWNMSSSSSKLSNSSCWEKEWCLKWKGRRDTAGCSGSKNGVFEADLRV